MTGPADARPATPAATVGDLLRRAALEFGDRVAVWSDGDFVTYAELLRRSQRLAGGLAGAGVRPGHRLAVWMPNTIDAFVCYFACALAGGVIVPVNTRLTAFELEKILDIARPAVVIIQEEFRGTRYLDLLSQTSWFRASDPAAGASDPAVPAADPAVRVVVSRPAHQADRASAETAGQGIATLADLANRAQTPPPLTSEPRQPADDWIIQFTSGTTSGPKGAVLSHAQSTRMGYELGIRLDLRPGDRFFVANPIYHLGASNFGLLSALAHGAGYYTLPTFDADRACEVLAAERCTHLHGIASHYLLEFASPAFRPADFALRVITVGGGSALARRAGAAFGRGTVMQRYGSSESSGAPISNSWTDPEAERLGSMGRPLPGVEVAIVDPDTGLPAPAGGTGEIRLRGWCVMQRYLGDPEATRAAVKDGWLHTGDLGRIDDGGCVVFMGRFSDVLKVGGENVASAEIEQVIESFPNVRAAHVVAVPDPVLSEVPYAFVEADGPVDEAGLRAFCAARLSAFKRPRYLRVIGSEAVPLTGTGKVQKFRLRQLAERDLGGEP